MASGGGEQLCRAGRAAEARTGGVETGTEGHLAEGLGDGADGARFGVIAGYAPIGCLQRKSAAIKAGAAEKSKTGRGRFERNIVLIRILQEPAGLAPDPSRKKRVRNGFRDAKNRAQDKTQQKWSALGIRNPFRAAGACLLLLIVCGTVAQEKNLICGKDR